MKSSVASPYANPVIPSTDADLTVIGAGPAGAATALFAARSGRRVVVFDRETFPRDKPCGEGLLPGGLPALRELARDAPDLAVDAPPLKGLKFGLPHQPPAVVGFPAYRGEQAGLGIRRLDFDARLAGALGRHPRIQFETRTDVTEVRRSANRTPTVVTSAGEVRARHVAVADGLRSSLRHRLGWTVGPRPPHRYGIVGHWQVEGPVDPWVQITVDDGLEVYEGPVAGNQRMVGLLCYQARMREFGGRLAHRYRELALALRPGLRQADQVGPVHAVGPFWYRATTVASDSVFLVGDASGFTDPITGEGIATGFRQARALVAALDAPAPERAYRTAHRRLTKDPRRVAALLLRLSRTPELVARGIRSHERSPQTFATIMGIGFGYWGFDRITPREWIRLFTGR
jgi:flavin-dependent dehydrogenase